METLLAVGGDVGGADRRPDGRAVEPAIDGCAAGARAGVRATRRVRGRPPVVGAGRNQHGDRVYRLAYRLTGNKHDAEDLTQEVFVRVFRSLSTYTPGNFEGWLHRITTNLFLDQVRRRNRIRFDALAEDADARGRTRAGPRGATTASLEADVQAALDALPPDFRAAVVLADVEGLTYEEIAETLDIKLGTVRSRIHRGRAQLRAALEHRRPVGRIGDPGDPGDRRPAVNPRPMTPPVGPHLGERVSSLVDGALADDTRDRALVHIAGCEECREQVETARLLKSRLAAAGAGHVARAHRPAAGHGRARRPDPPRPAHLPGQPRTAATPRPIATVPGRPATGRPQGSRPAGRSNRENVRGGRRTVRRARPAPPSRRWRSPSSG